MNKKSLIALLFAVAGMLACRNHFRHIRGSGNIVTEKRNVGNFTAIDAEGIISVEVKNGPEVLVEIEADDNLLPYIYTSVKNGVLEIDVRGKNSFTDVTMRARVTAPVLNDISASGTGNITVSGTLKDKEEIEFDNSGTGNITADVDAPSIKAHSSGVGTITLTGRCRDLDANVSGVGNIKAFELLSENADADVSGVGSIQVHASQNLKAGVSGAGSIRYRGGANVESSISGVGSVKKD